MKQFDKDIYFLRKTLKLAQKAEGFTSPNPLVGAVLVKNGRIIAQGYHKRAGLAHAEIEAIKQIKGNPKGATLYVNLEPCCHFGRTPPCVDEIIKKGIKRLVVATIDPNPKVCGKSIRKMRAAGIRVNVGLLRKEAKKLNEVFFTNISKERPFVAAKIAQSLDGKIATKKGLSKWITDQKSRLFAKTLRDKYDCVLIGVNTLIKDNPRLNGLKKKPYKVVIDPNLRLPLSSNLVKENLDKLIIFTSEKSKARQKMLPISVKVFFMKESKGCLPLRKILKILYSLGITSIFVEGGSQTLGRFFDEKLVDKLYLFISPKIIGGKGSLTSIGGEGFPFPNTCPYIKEVYVKYLGQDLLICGYPNYGKK